MNSFLSRRAKNTGRSAIREILKLTKRPEVISFAGGMPNPDTFPAKGLARSAARQISNNSAKSLQYGTTEGVEQFRQEMIDWLSTFGLQLELENVISTTSSQQAIDLACKTFIDSGDVVFSGSPTYLGASQAFSTFRAKHVGVPLRKDGMDLEVLEEKVRKAQKRGDTTKLVYLIPDFQNPTGVTLSEGKRRQILEIAGKYDLLIIEDTPYFGVRFAGKPKHPIGSIDEEGRVITIVSLSKILSSGMRLAVTAGPAKLLEKMVTFKQATDVCTPTTTQWIAYDWLEEHDLSEHLTGLRTSYRESRDTMLRQMQESFPENAEWTEPNGGLFLWVTLPEKLDADRLLEQCIKENVAFVPGRYFYVDDSGKNTLRLSYSLPGQSEIKEGIKRLGEVLTRELKSLSREE